MNCEGAVDSNHPTLRLGEQPVARGGSLRKLEDVVMQQIQKYLTALRGHFDLFIGVEKGQKSPSGLFYLFIMASACPQSIFLLHAQRGLALVASFRAP